jgi:hypothetical protein
MRPRGLEPPRTIQSTRPSTGCMGCRYVQRRPKRPTCAVSRTHWTGWTIWTLSKCCHGRSLARAVSSSRRGPSLSSRRKSGARLDNAAAARAFYRGVGISSWPQMAIIVPRLISRCRGREAILPSFVQMSWAAPCRRNRAPCCLSQRSAQSANVLAPAIARGSDDALKQFVPCGPERSPPETPRSEP